MTIKIIHPAHIADWAAINAPGATIRRATRDDVCPAAAAAVRDMDRHDRDAGCVVIVAA